MRIGLISDTHGYLNPRVYHEFDGVQHILHAGDVGDTNILLELAEIAPVNAVCGNVDGTPTRELPMTWCGVLAGVKICMTHGHMLNSRDYNRSAVEAFAHEDPLPRIIVHGHTHIGKNETREGITFINPGAACRPKFRDVSSIAILEIEPRGDFFVKFIKLEGG